MEVHKLGGASINSIERIKKLIPLFKKHIPNESVIIISAIGKTTNHLEELVNAYYVGNIKKVEKKLKSIKKFHYYLLDNIFEKKHPIYNEINNIFIEIKCVLGSKSLRSYDFEYDQIVSFGELLSSKIIHAFLNQNKIHIDWLDARKVLKTNNCYRNAVVNFSKTTTSIKNKLKNKLVITQGFIGSNSNGFNTTLGREGSDYTAAIFSNALDSKKATIWKDVEGIFTKDPVMFNDAEHISHISYYDAIELAFYGAKVIHPKTIQPLKEKEIPLHVKSFIKPQKKGTTISNIKKKLKKECIIIKENQVMLSISSLNFSFIEEINISKIFSIFSKHGIKVNLMQNSSIIFSVCMDHSPNKMDDLLKDFKPNFYVKYNNKLQLITFKNSKLKSIINILKEREVLLEQKNRKTSQYIVR